MRQTTPKSTTPSGNRGGQSTHKAVYLPAIEPSKLPKINNDAHSLFTAIPTLGRIKIDLAEDRELLDKLSLSGSQPKRTKKALSRTLGLREEGEAERRRCANYVQSPTPTSHSLTPARVGGGERRGPLCIVPSDSERLSSTWSVSPQPSLNAPVLQGVVGLQNLGNTCFMNACLQCLLSIPPLLEYFTSSSHFKDLNAKNVMRGALATAYGELQRAVLSQEPFSSISPSALKKAVGRWAPNFSGSSQQDCQEFLRFLLDGLHEDLNRSGRRVPTDCFSTDLGADVDGDAVFAAVAWDTFLLRNDSTIIDTFGGQLLSSVECLTCHRRSLCFDPFLDLSLPIPQGGPSTLVECLQTFIASEFLDGDEQYFCEQCSAHRRATKQLRVFRFPPVLVVHLKRFSYTALVREKVTTPVLFPVSDLDLSSFSCSPDHRAVYDLIGVSNHMGGTAGGHYTASCYNPSARQWFSFDDSRVSPCSVDELQRPEAYILFYQRNLS